MPVEDQKGMPYALAMSFVNEKKLHNIKNRIENLDPMFSSRKKRTMIKGIIVDGLESAGLMEEFCKKYY